MLRSIEIEGYKCFKNSKFEGFKRVNLITGLNNSGKSCLLEAIFLAQSPFYSTLQLINYFRSMPPDDISSEYFQNFFNEKGPEKELQIKGTFEIGCVELHLSLQKAFHKPKNTNLMSYQMIGEPTSMYGIPKDILEGDVFLFDQRKKFQKVTKQENKKPSISKFVTQTESTSSEVIFFPTKVVVNKLSLAKKFAKIVEKGLKRKFQKLITSVFSIEEIELVGDELMVLNDENAFKPMASYGDAFVNYCTFLIELFSLTSEHKYIIIDEFENGFHHTTHKKVWKAVIQLCLSENVQLFATTHSKEFTLAYAEAVKELQMESECGFMELLVSNPLNNIIGNRYPISVVEYSAENSKQFRGERNA